MTSTFTAPEPCGHGQAAYVGYCRSSGYRSLVSGASLPNWDSLSNDIQEAWERAADAVRDVMVEENSS